MKVKLFEQYEEIKKPNVGEIDEIESLLLKELYKKFPDSSYTTQITKWNDGTFMVEIRHGISKGDETKVHIWRWYNGYWKHTTEIY